MNLDRDLRGALQPLRGDPVDDAARVLAALGRRPRHGPPWPPWRYWLLAAVLAAAFGAGYACAGFAGAPAGGERPPAAPAGAPQEPIRAGEVRFMALGGVVVDEPGVGKQEIGAGTYRARAGSTFMVDGGLVGGMLLPNEYRVRLDTGAVATLAAGRVTLRAGRAWLALPPDAPPLRIDTGLATLELTAGSAVVDRRADSVRFWCLGGAAVLRGSGAPVRMSAMQQVAITDRGAGAVEKLAFAGAAVGWMVPLLENEIDTRELRAHLGAMIDAYLDGDHRDEAEYELRRLGALAVPGLHKAIAEVADDPALLARTAALLADLADLSQAAWLLDMLEREAKDVRVPAAAAFARVTGFAVEPESFWRAAPPAERIAAVRRWRAELR